MFHLIESKEDLNFLSGELSERGCLAIDTEFKRTSKDNLQLSLIQISDSEEIYIIDCIKIGQLEMNLSFLSSKEVEKVFHSCREDVEAIFSWTDDKLNNIFDTQLANAFLGGSFSISYQDIVKEQLGVSINKEETRSNWIRRPLRSSQLNYAASDVQFLLDVYFDQKRMLLESSKFRWLKEDTSYICDKIYHENNTIPQETFNKQFDKKEELNLLNKVNDLVLEISKQHNINPTLFFSKKNQKDFTELSFKYGINFSLEKLTPWRRSLLSAPLSSIFTNIL